MLVVQEFRSRNVCANKPSALDDLNCEYYYLGGIRCGKDVQVGGPAANLTIFFHPTISSLKYRMLPSFPDSILLVQVSKLLVVGSGLGTKVRYHWS